MPTVFIIDPHRFCFVSLDRREPPMYTFGARTRWRSSGSIRWPWSVPGDSGGPSETELRVAFPIIGRCPWRNGMSTSTIEIGEARARSVRVGDDALTVDLVDGRTLIVALIWFPRLWHASEAERGRFEVFGDGAYIHWPDVDEDVTVAGLVAGRRSGERATSLKKWMEARRRGATGSDVRG